MWTRFQSWGPVPWSMALLPFYRKKLDRSTQFGAVDYIITLYSSKSYVKIGGFSKFREGRDPPIPSGGAHRCGCHADLTGLYSPVKALQRR